MAEEQRILIVDDDPDITAQIRAFLTGDRLVIDVAHDTETAVKKFPAFRPHLVLLDVNMPGVSGFVALRRLKSLMSEHGIDCRVVMLTAHQWMPDWANISLSILLAGLLTFAFLPVAKGIFIAAIWTLGAQTS